LSSNTLSDAPHEPTSGALKRRYVTLTSALAIQAPAVVQCAHKLVQAEYTRGQRRRGRQINFRCRLANHCPNVCESAFDASNGGATDYRTGVAPRVAATLRIPDAPSPNREHFGVIPTDPAKRLGQLGRSEAPTWTRPACNRFQKRREFALSAPANHRQDVLWRLRAR
jgi:hypothetical protein